MNKLVMLIALFIGINTAKSQTANFTFKVENTTITTYNTSATPISNTDTFIVNWYFLGEGRLVYANSDSASFNFYTGGNYNVILEIEHLVKRPENQNQWMLFDTLQSIQLISVSADNTVNISGIVTQQNSTIKNANVHLLKKINDTYRSVRFSATNNSGTYTFDNVIADTFIIWVQPIICDTCMLNSTNTLPTYFGNTSKLDSAVKVIPSMNSTNYNIELNVPEQLNGALRVSGKVLNGNSIAGNTTLLLYDSNKLKAYRYTVSNSFNGEYILNEIEEGNYLLQPIIDGTWYLPINVSVSANSTVFDVNIETIKTSITKVVETQETINVYPNPFNQKINLNFENPSLDKSLTISNTQGKVVFKSDNFD